MAIEKGNQTGYNRQIPISNTTKIGEQNQDLRAEFIKIFEDLEERFENFKINHTDLQKNVNDLWDDVRGKSEKAYENNTMMNKSYPAITVIETGTKAYNTCLELLNNGYKQSGAYNITPIPGYTVTVYCDQETDGGGWIVFMRNRYGNITFDRTWNEYKQGFGHLYYDFWLGNEFLYKITTLYKRLLGKAMDLYAKLTTLSNKTFYAKYNTFFVDSEETKYFLRVSEYSGTAGDSLKRSHLEKCTTKDRDNDFLPNGNCANISYGVPASGGWWYVHCYDACLTKTHNDYDTVQKRYLPAPQWYHLDNSFSSLKGGAMMLREKS